MKGISPLIATILLIAFVVAIGGLISVWLTSLTNSQTSTVQSGSDTLTKCASTNLKFVSVKFPSSWTSGSRYVNVTVGTSGTVSLKNLTFSVAAAGTSTLSQRFFNASGDDLIPGNYFSTSINASNVTASPEIVTASVICGTKSIVLDCLAGQACMNPA